MFIKDHHRLKGFASLTVFILFNIILTTGCSQLPEIYKPGIYTNQAEGYYSTLIVEVKVDETHILAIKILSHEEPEILSEIVFSKLPPMMIKKNSNEVEVVSGASYTSKALIEAVGNALEQAKEALE